MGKSTVGGEFISSMGNLLEKSAGPKSVEKVSSFFESLRDHASREEIREITSKPKFDLKKLKSWVPAEDVEKEEREEINKVLERD